MCVFVIETIGVINRTNELVLLRVNDNFAYDGREETSPPGGDSRRFDVNITARHLLSAAHVKLRLKHSVVESRDGATQASRLLVLRQVMVLGLGVELVQLLGVHAAVLLATTVVDVDDELVQVVHVISIDALEI